MLCLSIFEFLHFMKSFVHFQDCHVESEALGLENVVGIFAILGLAMIFTALSLFLECFAKYIPSFASYSDTPSCID